MAVISYNTASKVLHSRLQRRFYRKSPICKEEDKELSGGVSADEKFWTS